MVLSVAGVSCAPGLREEPLQRYSYVRMQMGVRSEITVYSTDETAARSAASAGFEEINRLEEVFSDWRPRSELNRLSDRAGSEEAKGAGIPVSEDLAAILRTAGRVSERTGGAFDVTVGACTKLWREARRTGVLAAPEVLEAARATVDWRAVEVLPEGRVRMTRAGARLDLGGIAKGYAAERAVGVLRGLGVGSCLVALAGDVAAGEAPPGTRGWRVGIATGREAPGEAPADGVVLMANMSVSTSGDAAQTVEIGGERYAHIVDPRTGLGARLRRSASVVAEHGEIADALGKAGYLLGVEECRRLAREFRLAVVITDEEAPPAERVVEIDPFGLLRRP